MGDRRATMENGQWSMVHSLWSLRRAELVWLLALTLFAALLRFWMIGSKGLWYDEASTALMARASPAQIIQFHWNAAFEHPPLWVLLVHFWSKVFGQGEAALRAPSTLTGILAVPMIWLVAKTAWPARAGQAARLLAAGLVATSPVLILYSQEARMYSLVVFLALASAYLGMCLLAKHGVLHLAGFVLVNWMMLGLHYYSVLLIAIEAVFLLTYALSRQLHGTSYRRRLTGKIALAVGLSVLPFLLWASLAPGFRTTVHVVFAEAGGSDRPWFSFLDGWWRDLAFGSVRWQPPKAASGYLLLPLLLVGIVAAFRQGSTEGSVESPPEGVRWGVLFVLIVVLPAMVGLALARGMATRYILWVVPFAYLLVALGILTLWGRWRPLGVAGVLLAILVSGLGLSYYFSTYQKSEYREMATYLAAQLSPGDAIILEAPRQQLLTKYYLPSAVNLYPMPAVDLPDYWPVTAPPVVPEEVDHRLQAILKGHGRAWLVLTGENEVDQGEFVERYLTAIAYPAGCRPSLDVRLCAFVSPEGAPDGVAVPIDVGFEGGLDLRGVRLALAVGAGPGERSLYVMSLWHAREKPAADYKVTLRLLNPDGSTVSQSDGYPIGPLLPPTTWGAGDDKPGYMVLPIPATLPPGQYRVALGLYDPVGPRQMAYSGRPVGTSGLLDLGDVALDGAGSLRPAPGGARIVPPEERR